MNKPVPIPISNLTLSVFRFDFDWKWGQDKLDAVNSLMVVFTHLADPETRKEQLKAIDFERLHELPGLPTGLSSKIEGYFKNK